RSFSETSEAGIRLSVSSFSNNNLSERSIPMTGHKAGRQTVSRIVSGCTAALIFFICVSFLPPSAFSEWKDITDSVNTVRTRVMYNPDIEAHYFDISLANISGESFPAPVRLVIESVTPPAVTVHNADGLTDGGLPYYDFSLLLGDGKLDPDETSSALTAEFHNPDEKRFNFTFAVLSEIPEQLNRPPVLDSVGNIPAQEGVLLELELTASDPDGDTLT
ncbi:MAG: hypothetical protein GY820_35565, partial [Gammaproteobacteria bacterium]|nr:hypothetical protein [Gammaproteobacteria bacterium]